MGGVSIHFRPCHPQQQTTGNSFSAARLSLITKPGHAIFWNSIAPLTEFPCTGLVSTPVADIIDICHSLVAIVRSSFFFPKHLLISMPCPALPALGQSSVIFLRYCSIFSIFRPFVLVLFVLCDRSPFAHNYRVKNEKRQISNDTNDGHKSSGTNISRQKLDDLECKGQSLVAS